MALMMPGAARGGKASVRRKALSSSPPPTAAPRPKRQHRSAPSTPPENATSPRLTARNAEIQRSGPAPMEAEARGFFDACDQRWRFPSWPPDKKRSWSTTVTASEEAMCLLNTKCVSLSTFHSRTVLSAPPVTGRDLACKSMETTPDTCPKSVSMHRLVRKSQIFMDLSIDTVYRTLPSSSAATPVTGPKWPSNASLFAVPAGALGSQSRMRRSTPPETSNCRDSTRQRPRTDPKCPPHSKRFLPPG
mmetsp:Transcript_29860/g.86739  ORF Transcript_29860/g.86739 Transcript_29860/m.86739 type:complete len:247 (-) Transcript_29860:516-1256(-)